MQDVGCQRERERERVKGKEEFYLGKSVLNILADSVMSQFDVLFLLEKGKCCRERGQRRGNSVQCSVSHSSL